MIASDRRHVARRATPRTMGCPHCGVGMNPASLSQHLRDTGEATSAPESACPVLFIKRRGMKS
jgi:hypothetical protein